MNRSSVKDSVVSSRNVQHHHHHHHRRGLSLSLNGPPSDDYNLDLFSRSRRSFSVSATDEPDDLSIKLGRLSLGNGIGSVQMAKNGPNDLLSTPDGGKHDYDWLLTPPGTPLFPSSEVNESLPDPDAPRNNSAIKSVFTSKASRLSVSQSSEVNNRHRPARSSSVTRSSVSTSQFSSHSNKSSSILNTSSSSISSYIRASTPSRRPSSTGRPSTPSARPTLSRSSTPAKVHPAPNISSDQTRPSQNSRPSTPSSRPQTTANVNTATSRPSSRPSTPTRRNSAPMLSTTSGSLISVGRAFPNTRTTTSTSRPSSPSPRVVSTPPPVIHTDFSLETPRNLRTTLPDRPLSAGRSRPGAAVTVKGNVESPVRPSSPIVTRGRLQEPSSRSKITSNGLVRHTTDSHRNLKVSDSSSRKPVKTSTENPVLGRSISKKSMDMAIKHMDIRNGGTNGVRPNSGPTLFPQSIRSANNKIQISPGSAKNENCAIGSLQESCQVKSKLAAIDIYESSRYDTILLKEDMKNGSWLHSFDDKSDYEAIFDNGFDTLPEPFDPL